MYEAAHARHLSTVMCMLQLHPHYYSNIDKLAANCLEE